MRVQWLSIGVMLLEKPSNEILNDYCINKSLEAYIDLMFC
jgi:hypothetical protein